MRDIFLAFLEGTVNRDELSRRSGLPAHQIRYLVSEGILPPADAKGRSADAYSEGHLSLAVEYVRLHASGMRPRAIKELLQGGAAPVGGMVLRERGVEVRVTDEGALAAMSDADVGELAAALWRALVQSRDQARARGETDAGDEQAAGGGAEGRVGGRPLEGVRR